MHVHWIVIYDLIFCLDKYKHFETLQSAETTPVILKQSQSLTNQFHSKPDTAPVEPISAAPSAKGWGWAKIDNSDFFK